MPSANSINPLSDALVPIIRSEDLDDIAKDFVAKYYPEALNGSVAVNPYTLVRAHGFNSNRKKVSHLMHPFRSDFFR